jgi:peptide/nickel transport system substrate-binding protein
MTIRASFAAALLLLSFLGCGPQNSNALIYAQPEDPKTLDPINTDIQEAVHVITNLFDTLVTYHDETTELVPALAERWETSEDGLKWTFHLREGVLFHDGTPLNAEAVKLSLDRLIQAEHPLAYDKARPYQASYNMIAAVEAPDERTVVLKLHHPSAILLANLAMFPASVCSPAALKEKGADFAEHPVGTGPFKFVKWSRDQQLVCAAFDQHWRGRPKLDTLIWVPVKENATRVQRLERGEVHVAENLAPTDLEHLAKNPDLQVLEQVGMNVAYLTMQTEKPPLDNRKVREAIYLAIDKPTLIKVGYAGHALPAKSMVPPAMWGHDDTLVDHAFDRERAKQLLAEASAEAGFKLPLRLDLSVMAQARPYLPQPAAIAGFLKDSLREIGIEAEITPRDVNQHFDALMAGKHELGLAGWNSDNSDPDNFLYSLLDLDNISPPGTAAGNNLSRWRNDRFHELLLAGQKESDTAKRLVIYKEAQQIVLDEMPVVPLAHTNLRAAHAKRLKGYSLHPTGLVRLRGAYFEAAP